MSDFDVLAYRVATWEDCHGSLSSTTTALEVDGDAGSNAVGVVSVDGCGVNLFGDTSYRSFSAFVDAMKEAGQAVVGAPARTPMAEI